MIRSLGSLFFSLLCSAHLFSFSLTEDFRQGFYWDRFPIELSIVDDPSFSPQTISDLSWALEEAIREWEEQAPELDLWRVSAPVGERGRGRNTVAWDHNFETSSGLSGKHYLAVTVRTSQVPFITQVEILMNPEFLHLSREDVKNIMVHELGHTVGIDHSVNNDSIMSAAVRVGGFSPQQITFDDRAALQFVHDEMQLRSSGLSTDPSYQALKSSSRQNSSEEWIPSCGTIEDISSGGPGGGFGISLLVGFLFPLLMGQFFQQQKTV